MSSISTTPVLANRQVELIISRPAWEAAWRSLLLDDGQFAVGSLRRRQLPGIEEIILESVSATNQLPDGRSRPPLDDWTVLRAESHAAQPLPELAASCRPQSGQRLAVISIGGAGWSDCRAALWEDARLMPIDRIRVIGAGMLDLNFSSGLVASVDDDDRRASRTRGGLGPILWRRMRQMTATVVGCGRNGSQLAFQMAGAGIGGLRLIDGDIFQPENLDAMPGLTADDLGEHKTKALAQRLLQFRPDMRISYVAQSLFTDEGAALLERRADLYATCVDDETPRLAVAVAARESLTVHLDIGSHVAALPDQSTSMRADVRLLLPGAGCVSCVGGIANREEVLYRLAAPPGALRRSEPVPWFVERLGSLGHLNAVAVSTGVQAWLDLVAGDTRTSMWYRLIWEPGRGWRTDASPVGAHDECSFCIRNESARRPVKTSRTPGGNQSAAPQEWGLP